MKFLESILDRVAAAPSPRVQAMLLEAAQRDLSRLSEIDSTVAGLANFVSLYIGSQLQLGRLLSDNRCYSNNTTSLQANPVRNSIAHLLQLCLKLEYLFAGLDEKDLAAVKQLKLRTLALQLVYIVRASNLSALALCDNFLLQVESTERYLSETGLPPEQFTSSVFKEMGSLEEAKPGTVARILLPLLQKSIHPPPPRPKTTVRMCQATINTPSANIEVALKFTAGLVMGIPFDAEIFCLQNPNVLRIRVKYPDQQIQLIVPKKSDLRLLPNDAEMGSLSGDKDTNPGNNYRLFTTVLISHQVWTEACYVDISIVLDLSEKESGLVHSAQRLFWITSTRRIIMLNATVSFLRRAKQLPLPGNGTYEDFSKALLITEPDTLQHFLSPYKYITPAYAGDMAANERIAYEYCMNAAKDNVIYAEVRFSPHKSLGEKEYKRLGFAGLEAVVEATIKGLERGEKDFGITIKVLLTAYYGWPYGDQFEILKLCQKYDKVVGMDLCTKQPETGTSDEAPVTAELLFLFEEAKKTGVKTTIHAGEASGPKAIERAKDYYRCDRIGHGYHCVQDPVIYKSCLEEKIHFECCPWSSLSDRSSETKRQ
ncbi:hypothetical protein LSTR_LSTR012626 [Laodelphax striatellus]|uniref:Uncharacterized protein n=1 Tax=Laodelphax striatellus TaxID=195883 RepID=A0A482WNW2_LAOST|nr:hypothetical protein LSTR_LSTR012626 [Laodelphax striatellus]